MGIEADRIHVIGSGDKADVRLHHASIAPAHATLCAHDGRLIVEDLGTPGGTFVGGERIFGERDVPSGTTVSIGEIPIVITLGAPITPIASVVAHKHPAPTFGAIMAEELRRAPWFGLSTVLHALLFLVLYLLMPAEVRIDHGVAKLRMDRGDPLSVDEVDLAAEEPEIVTQDTPDPVDNLPDDPIESIEPDPPAEDDPAEPRSSLDGFVAPGVSLFAPIGGAGDGDVLRSVGGGRGGTAGFRRAVTGLRESGLEIVFVLDSTGSMGPVLDATKRRLVRMLEALHALVPDARVGIVTYRDRGPGEAYVTRNLELQRDLYRSLNFMQTVVAAGGGDRPEAVLEALQTAIDQDWRQGAKRVVVVIGDAPAHRWAEDDIDRLVKRFVRDGRGVVHAIMTSTDLFGAVSADTRKSFERIARGGHGLCVPSEEEDSILRQVLSLAIGTEFRDTIDEVFEILERRGPQYSARAREAVRSANPDAIARELRRPDIEEGFVQGLIDARSRAIVEALVLVLQDDDLPPQGRHAAAHALQQMLGLREPPVDPLAPGPIDARTARDVRAAAARLK